MGDGNWWIAPINSLPFTTTHTWAAAGTYTVLARGYVTCGGEVTRPVTVGSAPEPEALVSMGVSPLDAWALGGDETRLDVLESGPWVPDEAVFAPQTTVPLTVDLTGTGSGTVTSSPGGLVCAGTDGQTCSASFPTGTTVTLSPAPDAGSTFAGWGGACSGAGTCTVPLASARLVVATFTVPSPWVTQYYHTDALGSVRAVTDTTAAVVRTHDYHPFGEGVGVAAGTDAVRFTGKPRDAETGLDYFGARYYAQGAGRFTTVDPVYTWNDNLSDPQLWNRYIYARNNPSRFIDPDGRCVYPGADCLQYLIGGAKSIANLVPAAASLVNEAVNLVIGPVTDFRFGEAPRFEATNEDQRRGMIAADITMLTAPLASAGGASIDKWSRIPQSLMDELVLGAAQRGAGVRIIENLGDAKFKGMEKWSYSVESAAGIRSEVHYVRDPKTGHLMDFKFVHHGVKK